MLLQPSFSNRAMPLLACASLLLTLCTSIAAAPRARNLYIVAQGGRLRPAFIQEIPNA